MDKPARRLARAGVCGRIRTGKAQSSLAHATLDGLSRPPAVHLAYTAERAKDIETEFVLEPRSRE